jgi:uncharacterized membrane protein
MLFKIQIFLFKSLAVQFPQQVICIHLKLAIPTYLLTRFKLLAILFPSKQKLPSRENFCLEAAVMAIAVG